MFIIDTEDELKRFPNCEEGEKAVIESTKEAFVFTNGNWEKITAENGGLNMSLYELNASLISSLPPRNEDYDLIGEDISLIDRFVDESCQVFYNLMCKELPNGAFYNTILYRIGEENISETVGQAVISCLTEMGTIHLVSDEEDHIELWVKDQEENMICFLFFPCDNLIIQVA